MRDQTAIVGVGATPYYRAGASLPRTTLEMSCAAVLDALADAGLGVADVDGFAMYCATGYCRSEDPAVLGAVLGVPEVRFSATLTSGGGGSAGALGLAAAAVLSGQADVVVTVMALQQADRRLGGSSVDDGFPGLAGATVPDAAGAWPPGYAFTATSGLLSPGESIALLTRRHIERYGTKREHFAEICLSQRSNATTQPTALRRTPLTLDDYFSARMIAEPLCVLDYAMESDGAVAVVVTSAERARDLRRPPVIIGAAAHGGHGRWGTAIYTYFQMPDEYFASSGHRPIAERLYRAADLGPDDVDVALLYDHFTSMVIMQLEDYGFCPIGEGGPFVGDGNARLSGSIPVNPHGGHLSDGYVIGMTHIREAVEQLRGTAANQVSGADVALVTGGPAGLPVSGALLHR